MCCCCVYGRLFLKIRYKRVLWKQCSTTCAVPSQRFRVNVQGRITRFLELENVSYVNIHYIWSREMLCVEFLSAAKYRNNSCIAKRDWHSTECRPRRWLMYTFRSMRYICGVRMEGVLLWALDGPDLKATRRPPLSIWSRYQDLICSDRNRQSPCWLSTKHTLGIQRRLSHSFFSVVLIISDIEF